MKHVIFDVRTQRTDLRIRPLRDFMMLNPNLRSKIMRNEKKTEILEFQNFRKILNIKHVYIYIYLFFGAPPLTWGGSFWGRCPSSALTRRPACAAVSGHRWLAVANAQVMLAGVANARHRGLGELAVASAQACRISSLILDVIVELMRDEIVKTPLGGQRNPAVANAHA